LAVPQLSIKDTASLNEFYWLQSSPALHSGGFRAATVALGVDWDTYAANKMPTKRVSFAMNMIIPGRKGSAREIYRREQTFHS
jgi:hypothetical protein